MKLVTWPPPIKPRLPIFLQWTLVRNHIQTTASQSIPWKWCYDRFCRLSVCPKPWLCLGFCPCKLGSTVSERQMAAMYTQVAMTKGKMWCFALTSGNCKPRGTPPKNCWSPVNHLDLQGPWTLLCCVFLLSGIATGSELLGSSQLMPHPLCKEKSKGATRDHSNLDCPNHPPYFYLFLCTLPCQKGKTHFVHIKNNFLCKKSWDD